MNHNSAEYFLMNLQAGDAVAALKSSLKPLATVKRDGNWANVDATTVVPGTNESQRESSVIYGHTPAPC